MAATRLPASWMNALDPAAGARRSRWTAAPGGAPRCADISRRSRPASGPTVTVPSSVRRGELPRRLRAPFARNVIPGAHATDRARGRSDSQSSYASACRGATNIRSSDRVPSFRVTVKTYDRSLVEAFRQGLSEVGVVENRDVLLDIEWVSSEPEASQAVNSLIQRVVPNS